MKNKILIKWTDERIVHNGDFYGFFEGLRKIFKQKKSLKTIEVLYPNYSIDSFDRFDFFENSFGGAKY